MEKVKKRLMPNWNSNLNRILITFYRVLWVGLDSLSIFQYLLSFLGWTASYLVINDTLKIKVIKKRKSSIAPLTLQYMFCFCNLFCTVVNATREWTIISYQYQLKKKKTITVPLQNFFLFPSWLLWIPTKCNFNLSLFHDRYNSGNILING